MTRLNRMLVTAALAVLVSVASSQAALMVRYRAADYNDTTKVWADSSGNHNNATATGFSNPTLVTNATPNGSSAVQFNAGFGGYMSFTSIDVSSGFTILAFVMNDGGSGPFVSNTSDSTLAYRFTSGKQDILRPGNQDYGSGVGTTVTGAFANINVKGAQGTKGLYRLNGASDGMSSSNIQSSPASLLNRIGGGYGGQIAEIQVWNEQLTIPQIQAIEAQFNAAYVVPEPAALALTGIGGLMMIRRRR